MTNKEFYRDEIFEIACNGHTVAVCDGKPVVCEDTQCSQCDFRGTDCTKLLKEWLEKEHEESTEWKIQPEVKKLKQDDRVLVSTNGVDWIKRYFEKYDQKKDVVYAYIDGATSWSEEQGHASWKYAKLPEDEPKSKPEIDWSNVPVDAEILVRNYEDDEWKPRHFASSKGGDVYAWAYGCTSHTSKTLICWKYAKLAKEEE